MDGADEDEIGQKVETWLTLTPEHIAVGVLKPARSVAIQLRIHPDHLHLAPAVGVALQMTPAEARRIAKLLNSRADEAEAGLPRA
jgi:hypothetical protein